MYIRIAMHTELGHNPISVLLVAAAVFLGHATFTPEVFLFTLLIVSGQLSDTFRLTAVT